MNAHMLARFSSCWVSLSQAGTFGRSLHQTSRLASSQAKPRVVKTARTTPDSIHTIPKKKISTKSAKSKASDLSPPAAVPTPRSPPSSPATTAKKTTRANPSKTAANAPVKTVTETPKTTRKPSAAVSKQPVFTPTSNAGKNTAAVTTQGQTVYRPSNTSASAPGTAGSITGGIGGEIKLGQATSPSQSATGIPGGGSRQRPGAKEPINPSSPEFKRASRKYTSVLVSLPILIVTSYFLYDRLARGNPPKSLDAFRQPFSEQALESKPGAASKGG